LVFVATLYLNCNPYMGYGRLRLSVHKSKATLSARKSYVISVVLILILVFAAVSLLASQTQSGNGGKDLVYVGVAFGGNTTQQAKLLIDRTKSFTNLFILDSGINRISTNQSAVQEICDYAVNSGLSIIVNLGTWTKDSWDWRIQFYNQSRDRYGDKFLGAYYDVELGGIQLDWDWSTFFSQNSTLFDKLSLNGIYSRVQTGIHPDNYTQEAQWFNQLLENNKGHISLKQNNITTFTSDYALYWFDYLGGYSTLFAQLGWNESVTQQIALVRGAATLQNKDWGTIITWKYRQPPYLDSGENIYNQMVSSYNAGAKYITIFNYPYNSTDNPYGAMTDAHFQALEKFWNQVEAKSPPNTQKAEEALVLPKDYGWGMRSPTDKIWGFWGPDEKSPIIWNNTQTLLGRYGLRLDIIFDDPAFPIQGNYSKLYVWNQTIT
jgi:hypothetical protein